MAKSDLTMGEMKEAIACPGALMRLARGVLTGLVVLGLVSTLGAQVASASRVPSANPQHLIAAVRTSITLDQAIYVNAPVTVVKADALKCGQALSHIIDGPRDEAFYDMIMVEQWAHEPHLSIAMLRRHWLPGLTR